MADAASKVTVSLMELVVSTLAMTDATTKLLIDKGIFTEEEVKTKLLEGTGSDQRILSPTAH